MTAPPCPLEPFPALRGGRERRRDPGARPIRNDAPSRRARVRPSDRPNVPFGGRGDGADAP